jgi:uncharacterized membrane protein YeaQ/YmgE (transglycosylase-associated protein family)
MEILFWILFGALVGWVASLIMKTDAKQGALANIAVGIVGAILGGFIANLFGSSGVTGFNITSFIWALVGSLVLLAAYRAITGGGTSVHKRST